MLQTVRDLLLPAAQARVLLLVNHVLLREPAALRRLAPHAGRQLRVELTEVPAWLPGPPPMRTIVSAAGLFEPLDARDAPAPDLTLRLAMPAPQQILRVLAGETLPDVRIDGDAQIAADMHWLVENLRWDIESDLAQALGATPARVVMSAGRAGARALRGMFASVAPQSGGATQ
jgi:ubiquinone biosynthesis protein UbiJ